MTKTPTIIRAGQPRDDVWKDQKRGHVTHQTRIDGSAGPTSSMAMGTASIAPGDEENMHHHDVPEIAYVTSGGGTAVFSDHEVRLDSGDTVFVPAGMPHSWRAGEEGMNFLYVFPCDRMDEVGWHWAGDA